MLGKGLKGWEVGGGSSTASLLSVIARLCFFSERSFENARAQIMFKQAMNVSTGFRESLEGAMGHQSCGQTKICF